MSQDNNASRSGSSGLELDNNDLKAIDLNLLDCLDLNSIEFFKAFYESEISSTCLYYDIESFSPVFKNTASNFLILSNNVRSLGNNFTSITNLIDEFKSNGAAPDIFAMQEIWNHPVESLNIDGYNLIAKPRTGGIKGGGGHCSLKIATITLS